MEEIQMNPYRELSLPELGFLTDVLKILVQFYPHHESLRAELKVIMSETERQSRSQTGFEEPGNDMIADQPSNPAKSAYRKFSP